MNAARMDLETSLSRDTTFERVELPHLPGASADVLYLPGTAIRTANRAMFQQLCARVHSAHGDFPELNELQSSATRAVMRFPVFLLGPGLARVLADMQDGRNGFRNVLQLLVHAENLLTAGQCCNAADALVRAFSAHHRTSLEETRQRLIDASHDCEFFSPEVVLMLEALSYA